MQSVRKNMLSGLASLVLTTMSITGCAPQPAPSEEEPTPRVNDDRRNHRSDPDRDGIVNIVDNCPTAYNPDQTDTDRDGQGDACDHDPYCAVNTDTCFPPNSRFYSPDTIVEQRATTIERGEEEPLREIQEVYINTDARGNPLRLNQQTGIFEPIKAGNSYTVEIENATQTFNVTSVNTDRAGETSKVIISLSTTIDYNVDTSPIIVYGTGTTIFSYNPRNPARPLSQLAEQRINLENTETGQIVGEIMHTGEGSFEYLGPTN